MARIAGIDIPRNKRGVIALTYIYGIGRSRAAKVLADAGVDENKNHWYDHQNDLQDRVGYRDWGGPRSL